MWNFLAYFYVKTKVSEDFCICISVPLKIFWTRKFFIWKAIQAYTKAFLSQNQWARNAFFGYRWYEALAKHIKPFLKKVHLLSAPTSFVKLESRSGSDSSLKIIPKTNISLGKSV